MKYYYDQQLTKYLVQFMAIFHGMVVMPGPKNPNANPISVPVQYGSKDRVAASILNNNTQNQPLRLPVMSAYIRDISMAPERYKGVDTVRKINYLPRGGIFPNDIQTSVQLMPVPYNTTMELCVYSSNQNTQFQILEQIMMIFNPMIQIQSTDGSFDWTRITTVELKGFGLEENYPSNTERRMIITTLSFEVPVWISAPAALRQDIIKEIYMRVGEVSDLQTDNYNILSQLDANGDEYEKIIDAADIFPSTKVGE